MRPYVHGPGIRWYMSLNVDQVEAAYRVIEAAEEWQPWAVIPRILPRPDEEKLAILLDAVEAWLAAKKGG